MRNIITKLGFIAFFGILGQVSAQTPEGGIKPSVITGDVATLGTNKIVLNVKSGSIEVLISDKTEFKKVSPENPALKAATASALSEIGVGDRLLVTGVPSADGRSIPARAVYVMTKADITQKAAKETEQWRTRGISGKVMSVDQATAQITLQVAGLTDKRSVILTAKEKARFLRYAPDSIRFDEAVASSVKDIHPGDMVRALGDKSADGASFAAEEVISGAFQTIAGTVKSVDAAANEVVIQNLLTKKDVTILIGGASIVKRFPAEMAERMAGLQMAGGARPAGQGSGAPAQGSPGEQGRAPGAGQGQGGQRGGFGGQRSGGLDDMLDRFPNITAADLKAGDMIAVSSTKNTDNSQATNGVSERVKAIKLLAGVEPFLRMAQAPTGGQRGQGVQGGFTIPGLDGVSFP